MRGEQPRSLVQAVRVHTALLYLLQGGFASRYCHGRLPGFAQPGAVGGGRAAVAAAEGDAAPRPSTQHLTALKEMIRFIYGHYTEKVTLEQICRAGHVGKTTCCSVFQKYTGESPISYLTS